MPGNKDAKPPRLTGGCAACLRTVIDLIISEWVDEGRLGIWEACGSRRSCAEGAQRHARCCGPPRRHTAHGLAEVPSSGCDHNWLHVFQNPSMSKKTLVIFTVKKLWAIIVTEGRTKTAVKAEPEAAWASVPQPRACASAGNVLLSCPWVYWGRCEECLQWIRIWPYFCSRLNGKLSSVYFFHIPESSQASIVWFSCLFPFVPIWTSVWSSVLHTN